MKQFDEIFDLWYGVNLELINCEQIENGIPFVSRQSTENGVAGYVMPIDIIPNPAHTLSIACSGSVLSTFYHDYEYYSGRDVYIAKPKQKLTREQMIFYALIIEQNKYRYNYGRQANKTLKNILLPDIKKLPDYVNEISTANNKFDKEPIIHKKIKLNTDNWRWFRYDEIFEIIKGKTLTKDEMIDGDIPFVSSTSLNNGISAKIGNNEHLQNANTISVNSNGSIGYAFYQPLPYWASGDNNILICKDGRMNKYIAMFLCTLIEKERYRYNYGRKWGKEIMQQSAIKLPAAADGSPDWQFMENYIKALPYSKSL